MLKKHEPYDRTGRCDSSNTRQLDCVFQDVEPPKLSSILRKSWDIRKPILCAVVRHADIRDQNLSLGMVCPGELHQRNPNAPKCEDRSQEETEWQERCAREAAWRLAKSILNLMEKIKQHSSHFRKRVACLHQILNLRNENLLSTLERQCTWSAKRTWVMLTWILWRRREVQRQSQQPMVKCRRMRGNSVRQRTGYILDDESPRVRQQSYRSESFAMKSDIPMNGSMVKKPHLIQNGIRILCNTENFAPIVVPGLSTSSSSSSPSSTSMTLSRQESKRPTSSSSSSTSPTTTVPSDSETREREGLSGIDSHPVLVWSPNVEEMIERGDPLFAAKPAKNPNPAKTQEFRKNWWMMKFQYTETHTPVLLMKHL